MEIEDDERVNPPPHVVSSRSSVWLAWGVAAAAAIFALGVTSVHFAPPGSQVAAWWPAAGVAAALLALSPPRRWPPYLGLIALATFGANLAAGRDIGMASIFAFAGTVEPVVVALVLGAHHARPTLTTMADARRLMLAALAGATVVGVLAGTT